MLERIPIVDVEMEELLAKQRSREHCARGAPPHQLVEVFGVEAHHFRVVEQSARDERQHGVAARQDDLRLRLEGLRLQAVLQRGPALPLGHFQVAGASGVQAISEPTERFRFVDRSLDHVTESARPVDGELSAQLVSDLDRVLEPPRRILADLRSLGRRARSEDGMEEGLAGDHRAPHPVLSERVVDLFDDLPLAVGEKVVSVDDVAVVSRPAGDAELAQIADDLVEPDWFAGRRVEERLAFVGTGPLRAADEVLPPLVGSVAPAG